MVARQELGIPLAITYEQVKSFTIYATRTILSVAATSCSTFADTNVRRRVFS
jgi:pyruvate dehydrogenase (quinone)